MVSVGIQLCWSFLTCRSTVRLVKSETKLVLCTSITFVVVILYVLHLVMQYLTGTFSRYFVLVFIHIYPNTSFSGQSTRENFSHILQHRFVSTSLLVEVIDVAFLLYKGKIFMIYRTRARSTRVLYIDATVTISGVP